MIYGLYHSAAGMMSQEYRMDALSNNLANADTVGFKREIATLAQRKRADEAGVRRGPSADDLRGLSGGVWQSSTRTDFSEAGVLQTGQPLDAAILGPGFLQVEKNGQSLLTRDGRMTMMPDGALVAAADGSPILGQGGAPIRLNPLGGPARVTDHGAIVQGGVELGRLGLVDVDNVNLLRKAGGGRFALNGAQLTDSPAEILPGHVERSGSEPVREMVSMMEASRAYQFNAQMITLQDQSAGRLIAFVAGA